MNKTPTTLEESVIQSMDGSSTQLIPFLPYILQDIWEIGTSPEIVLSLIKKHTSNHSDLKVLDLGCGKGAVSITLARELKCYCHGIDGIYDFVQEAKNKAKAFKVEESCHFECSDIRERVSDLHGFDVVVFGATGPVFGDYYSTLVKVSQCLSQSGVIVLDDAYIEDSSDFRHPSYSTRTELLKAFSDAGMALVDEVVMENEAVIEADEAIYQGIHRRCQELIDTYPDQKNLFVDYIKQQEEENEMLETTVTCSTMLLRRCV